MALTLYQLPPSPNNVKVRLALGLKDIPSDRVDVGLEDRAVVVEATGQPLTPAIVHDGTVLFGSGAILRYIDANWRGQGPRLFSETRDGMRAIEDWEKWANQEFSRSIVLCAHQWFSKQDDPAATAEAQELLAKNTPRIEEALSNHEYLLGDHPTAADVTLFPWVSYALADKATAPAGSPAALFAEKIQLPPEFTKTRAWVAKLAQHAG